MINSFVVFKPDKFSLKLFNCCKRITNNGIFANIIPINIPSNPIKKYNPIPSMNWRVF